MQAWRPSRACLWWMPVSSQVSSWHYHRNGNAGLFSRLKTAGAPGNNDRSEDWYFTDFWIIIGDLLFCCREHSSTCYLQASNRHLQAILALPNVSYQSSLLLSSSKTPAKRSSFEKKKKRHQQSKPVSSSSCFTFSFLKKKTGEFRKIMKIMENSSTSKRWSKESRNHSNIR